MAREQHTIIEPNARHAAVGQWVTVVEPRTFDYEIPMVSDMIGIILVCPWCADVADFARISSLFLF
jgi:hypothetical protein